MHRPPVTLCSFAASFRPFPLSSLDRSGSSRQGRPWLCSPGRSRGGDGPRPCRCRQGPVCPLFLGHLTCSRGFNHMPQGGDSNHASRPRHLTRKRRSANVEEMRPRSRRSGLSLGSPPAWAPPLPWWARADPATLCLSWAERTRLRGPPPPPHTHPITIYCNLAENSQIWQE